jgi:hypothetical protein
MPSNASRLSDFASGIGTQGATLQIDTANQRVGIGTTNPQATLQVGSGVTVYGNIGIISATSFFSEALSAKTVTISAGIITATFNGSGVGLTSLNASNLTSGTISSERYSSTSNAYGIRTVQSGGTPSGGNNGDIYYIY